MTADTSPENPRDERPLLVTSALPYANGPLHLGHLVGAYLPADVFVRYHRLRGTDVLFICGTDEHGVSITVKAEEQGLPYREYVARWHDEIKAMFDTFGISFDHFSRTSNEDPHYPLSQEFFLRLLRSGAIKPRTDQQHYCLTDERFLPDRYVEGTCYICGGSARGDECKQCGSWLEAVKLIDPRCVTCGNEPEIRDTMQYELDLSGYGAAASESDLPGFVPHTFRNWLLHGFEGEIPKGVDPEDVPLPPKPNVRTMVFDKLLVEGDGLRARPITRDLRWGVPLPVRDLDGNEVEGHEGKVLYVWFDAPIGYVSATIEWARQFTGDESAWRRYWIVGADHEYGLNDFIDRTKYPEARGFRGPRLLHFVGKDNIPFHCVVFPSMLGWQGDARKGDDFHGPGPGERWVLPEAVPANEFYNLEGGKFSTSDGRTLDNDHLVERFGVDALRWYLVASMPETADSHFRFGELATTVNADLADKIGNYASRVLKFVKSKLDGMVPKPDEAVTHNVPGGDGSVHADTEPGPVPTVAATRALCEAFFEIGSAPDRDLSWHLEQQKFRESARILVGLARTGNEWFDSQAPWKTFKEGDLVTCRTHIWAHVQILSALAVGMWPFMPGKSDELRRMLNLRPLSEQITVPRTRVGAGPADAGAPAGPAPDLWRFEELPAGHALGEPGILFSKVPPEVVEEERATLEGAS